MNSANFFAELKRRNVYKIAVYPRGLRLTGDAGTMMLVRNSCVDRKPAFWESGCMKTTLDLPDDLMRAVKIRAVHEQKKLKDAIAEFIRKGMAAGKSRPAKAPKPVKLRGGPITTEEIEAAIAWGRE